VSLLAIFPSRQLPDYRPGEVPSGAPPAKPGTGHRKAASTA